MNDGDYGDGRGGDSDETRLWYGQRRAMNILEAQILK